MRYYSVCQIDIIKGRWGMEINIRKFKNKKISRQPPGTENDRSKTSGGCGIFKLYG